MHQSSLLLRCLTRAFIAHLGHLYLARDVLVSD